MKRRMRFLASAVAFAIALGAVSLGSPTPVGAQPLTGITAGLCDETGSNPDAYTHYFSAGACYSCGGAGCHPASATGLCSSEHTYSTSCP